MLVRNRPTVSYRRTQLKPLNFVLALAVLAHLVLALGMAANHEVHERIHGGANGREKREEPDHERDRQR